MLSLESTSSRMSHLARQEIYFGRQFTLDETLRAIEARHGRRTCSASLVDLFRDGALVATVARDLKHGRYRRTVGTWTEGRTHTSCMITRYTHPEMGAIWSDGAATTRGSRSSWPRPTPWRRPASCRSSDARDFASARGFDIARIEEIEQTTQHDVIAFTTAVAENVGRRGALAALRAHVVGRHRHGARAADARRPAICSSKTSTGWPRRSAPCRRASAHADDRQHARRARGADDVRRQARALVRRDSARDIERVRRARATISVGKLSGAVGIFAHLPIRRLKPTSAAAWVSSRRPSRPR